MFQSRLTQSGYDRLQSRLVELREKRARLREEVDRARSEGDLSENAGYHAAREALAITELQIKSIELRLGDSVIIDNLSIESAEVGCTVTLRDLDTLTEMTYKIAEIEEHDGTVPVMTPSSPLGKLVLGKAQEELIEFESPRGLRRLLLLSIAIE